MKRETMEKVLEKELRGEDRLVIRKLNELHHDFNTLIILNGLVIAGLILIIFICATSL